MCIDSPKILLQKINQLDSGKQWEEDGDVNRDLFSRQITFFFEKGLKFFLGQTDVSRRLTWNIVIFLFQFILDSEALSLLIYI